MVFLGGQTITHPLPASGSVSLGRSEECDVRIDDPSVSRRHALLHVGPPLRIEDLGSVNGTRVRQTRASVHTAEMVDAGLEQGRPVQIEPGDAVTLGAVVVVVRSDAATAASGASAGAAGSGAASGAQLVVRDPEMRRLFDLARRVAESDISVLLLGETGVGKEVFAAAIHRHSTRNSGPFLGLNCGALTETLLESELFGHEKGAFTGATAAKPGLLEAAAGGTVFLDEVGEMPMATQVKLLRVLETREVMRVGALKPRPIDVRFVSATNRDLEAEAAAGRFRQDLYFRLNGIALRIPPLRARLDELEDLARLFVARAAAQMGRATTPALSPEAVALLRRHAWPGNIRELRNVMERAVVLCAGPTLQPEHLLLEAPRIAAAPSAAPAPPAAPAVAPRAEEPDEAAGSGALKSEIEALERKRILDALAKCGGNQSRAAEMLGVSRRTLVTRLDSYGITRPRKKS